MRHLAKAGEAAALVLTLVSVVFALNSDRLDAEQRALIREALLHQEHGIRTFVADFSATFVYMDERFAEPPGRGNSQDIASTMRYRYAWKDGMRSCRLEAYATDGTLMLKCHRTVNRDRGMTRSPALEGDADRGIVAQGVIHDELGPDMDYVPQRFTLISAAGDRLSRKFEQGRAEIIGFREIGDNRLIAVRVKVGTEEEGRLWLYVDPERNYALVRMHHVAEDGLPMMVFRVTEFGREGDVYFPTEAYATMYVTNRKGERFAAQEVKLSVTKWSINVDLPDETFDQEFPVGTRVYDAILDYGYISGRSPEQEAADLWDEEVVSENCSQLLPTPADVAQLVADPQVQQVLEGQKAQEAAESRSVGGGAAFFWVLALVGTVALGGAIVAVLFCAGRSRRVKEGRR
jgi:hypothetical protein